MFYTLRAGKVGQCCNPKLLKWVWHHIPDNTVVLADINHVEIILRNLISNTIKFTKSGGNIAIEATAQPTHIRIAIRDTGVGMSQTQMQDLFTHTNNA